MAKLSEISLSDLYARKITSSVEQEIMKRDDFSTQSKNWCSKVCKLNCKNPPSGEYVFDRDEVDVLIIQDFKAFDDVKFNRRGAQIELKHLSIIKHFADKVLRDSEGARLTYGVTSLLKCQIQAPDIKKGKAPTDTVLQKCKPYLLQEIQIRKPKVIISLSTSVTKVLGLPKKSNYNDRGEILVGSHGIPIVLTGHPRILLMLRQNSSGKMWGPDFYSVILRDFEKAARIVRGELGIPDLDTALEEAKKRITVAQSIPEVASLMARIREESSSSNKIYSVDTETTGLDPFSKSAKLLCIQFGFRDSDDGLTKSFVIPLWHRDNKRYDPQKAWELVAPILLDETIRKIGHNIKFDIMYIACTTGIRMNGVLFDTMLLLHAINSGIQGMYGLKKAVHDWLPETGLGGYEDKLPKLTKKRKLSEENLEETEEENDE